MSVNDDSNGNAESGPLLRSPEPRRFVGLSLEIPLFMWLFNSSLTGNVTSNLLLYRICTVDLGYNATTCALLNIVNKTDEARALEAEVQAKLSILNTVLSLLGSIVPAILVVFLGGWSDKYGRKPLVVVPLFGLVISGVLVVTFSAIPSLSAYWFVICILPSATLGGAGTFMLGASLIAVDVTNDDNRSFRLAVLESCAISGMLVGTASSSFVYDAMGYVPMFSFTTAMNFASLLYTILLVKETLGTVERGGFTKIFNVSLIKGTFRTCFKKRDKVTASILTLLIISYWISMVCMTGVGAVGYLFTRLKFQWLLRDFTIFSAASTILGLIGMVLGTYVFQSYFKVSDGILLILAYLSYISDSVVRSLAQKSWHMYLAGCISVFGILSVPLLRSQISKVLPQDEVAKMFSLISCLEAATPIFAPIIFNWVYYSTLAFFPGFIYVISGSLFTVCLILVIIINYLHRRRLNLASDGNLQINEDNYNEQIS